MTADDRSHCLMIQVIRLPRIANFDDLELLAAEPGIAVRFVRDADDLGAPDLLVLPGSKSTLADLATEKLARP